MLEVGTPAKKVAEFEGATTSEFDWGLIPTGPLPGLVGQGAETQPEGDR
jgi:hypothetical protein